MSPDTNVSTMPSVLANEDQPMGEATEGDEHIATEPQESFIDLNEQRIRIVSLLTQSTNGTH